MSRALVWLRRDLRHFDSAALAAAAGYDEVAVAFVFDELILAPLAASDPSDRRVTFLHRSIQELREKLNGNITLRYGDPVEIIPQLAKELQVETVVFARDWEDYARRRDREVSRRLAEAGIKTHPVVDHVVQSGETVLNQSGLPFRVFTPYSKAWRARVHGDMIAERPTPRTNWIAGDSDDTSLKAMGFHETDLWLEAGEEAARTQLHRFVQEKIQDYAEKRDFPAIPNTSALSVHLRFGTVSIRECFRLAAEFGATKWESELIWREFYSMLLYQFPEVETTTFQPQYRDLEWPGDPAHLVLWKQGQTGYPIVDAAMRCLNATGWMHNRLRMITASFLTKDLLIDYREGEAYFAAKLLDFDLASNNGGWQWAASVGCDAQPYFRIFNPMLQSKKFDPEGEFIRQWLPERAHLDAERIHEPTNPIVDHAEQKEKAIRLLSRSAVV